MTTIARTLLATLAAVVLALGLTSCSGDGGEGGTGNGAAISVDAFADRAADADVVLDVRTPAEFAAGHLPNAVNVDVESPDFASRIATLDKEASYAVYCRSGSRSGVAVEQMVDEGFTDVQHLAGGIVDWQSKGGPVVTD